MPPKVNQIERLELPETPESEFSFQTEEQPSSGESVKVALRLRPMNTL